MDILARVVSDALIAHHEGAAGSLRRRLFAKSQLDLRARFVGSIQKYGLGGLWSDSPPQNNRAAIALGSSYLAKK